MKNTENDAIKANTIQTNALKAEAYDLLTERGRLLNEAQALETRINEIAARIEGMKNIE